MVDVVFNIADVVMSFAVMVSVMGAQKQHQAFDALCPILYPKGDGASQYGITKCHDQCFPHLVHERIKSQ